MRARRPLFSLLALAVMWLLLSGANTCLPAGGWQNPHEPVGQATFTSPQADPIALSPDGTRLYVVNTTSNSVTVIDTVASDILEENIRVGLDPVSVAVRPDGKEVWVSNHVSDSVSVIDTDPVSGTYHQVIRTIQELSGGVEGSTTFDEPVGIAFASNSKAYVALSSINDVAVIDATAYSITSRLHITAQEPRAIKVANGRLYVAVLESFNQSELSICPNGPLPGETDPSNQCTLDQDDLVDFVVSSPNIPGADARIVIDPDMPDRDLFVFSTVDESVVDEVSGVGTLLYGLAVSSTDEVFVSQADSRNAVNGLVGENVDCLENRMFFNRIAQVNCNGASCGSPSQIELEPLPQTSCGGGGGAHPAAGEQLATPYGIAISDDDSTLVATAAASSRIFTVNASTGAVRDILDVGAIPRGIALASDGLGAPETAYVLNTLDNSVSVVDVSDPDNLSVTVTFPVGDDPTPNDVRLGRIAFNDANASSTGTFSCASCHPDGNTDQLLWRIGGPCFFGACTGDDEIRSTMPMRGLKNTLPLHWDGTLGDPNNDSDGSLGGSGSNPPDCTDDQSCFRHLADSSLSGVMCTQPSCPNGPSGQAGLLTVAEREDMATFLQHIAYPPARARRIDDDVSNVAVNGFSDFFVDKPEGFLNGDAGDALGVVTCADHNSGCHALPLTADTDSSTLAGFDVPTMRGMTDRTLQFSIGITNAEESLVAALTGGTVTVMGFPLNFPAAPAGFRWDPADGPEEHVTFASAFAIFDPVYGVGPANMFRMFEEAATNTSGATGRQVTLSQATLTPPADSVTLGLLDGLEDADIRGVVNLLGNGERNGTPVTVSYEAGPDHYQVGPDEISRATLETEVGNGDLIVTLTGHLPSDVGKSTHPDPLLGVDTDADGPSGTNPDIPIFTGTPTLDVEGIDVRSDAVVFVDGLPDTGATVSCTGGSFTPFCSTQSIQIQLGSSPSGNGLHLLQVQNGPAGPMSNELPICKGNIGQCD